MARIGWYVRRLRAMEPSEVVSHGRRAVSYRADDLRWRAAPRAWRTAWEPDATRLLGSEPYLGRALGVLDRQRAESARSACASGVEELLASARRRLDGYVQVLGYPELRQPEDAATDPVTGARWPNRHGRMIDYRHGAPGDPKLVWELNRMQELPLLCAAWLLSDEERFASAALDRLTRWLAQNPPGRGVAWANAYEPGIRAISLAVAFDALRAHGRLVGETAQTILRGLWQHARWIEHDRSGYSSANNHLVGELTGLLAIGLLAPELRDAGGWVEFALDGLVREAELQVLADGSGPEQSFAYGLFVADLLLVAIALLDARGAPVPDALGNAIRRTGDMLAALLAADEPDPAFGDADDGRTILLAGAGPRDARGVAASIAARFCHAGARRVAGQMDVQAAFLFGSAGVERFDGVEPAPEPRSSLLPDGGLVVLRAGGSRALFDVGSLGYLSIAAHGHADALQVVLSHGSVELIPDPGTGSYFRLPEVRAALRGTRCHATVTVDGQDQAESRGSFLWSRHADGELTHLDLERGIAIGTHDGYARLDDPVRHRRALVALGSSVFVVYDRLDAAATHELAVVWPLAPGLEIAELSAGGVDAIGDVRLYLRGCASVPTTATLEQGPFSRRLEEIVEAPRHVITATFTGRADLATILVIGGSPPEPVGLVVESGGSCVLSAVVADVDRRIVFDLDRRKDPVTIDPPIQEGML